MRKKIVVTINDLKENKHTTYQTTAIVNNNKITYHNNETKEQLRINQNDIILKRESPDFIHTINFIPNNIHSTNYYLKETGLYLEINVKTQNIIKEENKIIINYTVIESNNDYQYIIEMRD